MNIRCFEKGFNYSQDGPGNRLVYHLQGCNMHCPWCSNPEGLKATGGAHEYTIDEMVSEVLSCRPMFFDGGGVTFTGGECTLQHKALIAVIQKIKENHITVAIESNAMPAGFMEVVRLCDYVMLDYKHPDSKKLQAVTGGDLSVIERHIRQAAAGRPVHIRIPLIHGFNDHDAAFEGFLQFFHSLQSSNFDVELLPYHEYGRAKWEKIGVPYTVTDGHVSAERVEALRRLLENNTIKTIKT